MSDSIKKPLTIQELTSKAGKASVAKLTKEQLRERAIKASHSRKYYKDMPKAKHSGNLIIGDKVIACFVLEDGTRILSTRSIQSVLGKNQGSSKTVDVKLPPFLSSKALKPFITKTLEVSSKPIKFILPKGGIAHGYKAELLPEICDVFLKAKDKNVLHHTQKHIAIECDIIVRALSKVGIFALVDEATGFQYERERDELQTLLTKYISAELLPWTRRFPQKFFDAYKKMYGINKNSGCPSHVGHLINSHIYEELAPGVKEELQKKNPKEENGRRKHTHHQFLTDDIGIDALQKQLIEVTTLMKISKDKENFEELYKLSREEDD